MDFGVNIRPLWETLNEIYIEYMNRIIRNTLYAAAAALIIVSCEKDPKEPEYQARPYCTIADDNMNLPCGGTLRTDYSDAPKGCEIGMLIDGDVSTYYQTNHQTVSLLVNAAKAIAVENLSLVSSPDSPEYDPAGFKLLGSNDNKTWEKIAEKKGFSFEARSQMLTWDIKSGVAYRYIKLNITANNGGEMLKIAEMALSEAVPDSIDDLMHLADKWTTSSVTPMGKHYEKIRTATEDQMAWLNDPSKNPPLEASKYLDPSKHSWKTREVQLYPFGNPIPADVNQYLIGDCCQLAVFASFAWSRPDFIKDIITQNGNNFIVKMFNPAGEPITVAVDNTFVCGTDGKLRGCRGKNDIPTWASVMEKAVMKWEYIYKYNYPIDGIGYEHVVPLFTGDGNSYAFKIKTLTPEQMKRVVIVCLNQGYILGGGFAKDNIVVEDPFMSQDLHAFTFMYATSPSGLFAMRNPYGNANGSPDGKEDGVMNIPNDKEIVDLIDIRVCYPGTSKKFMKSKLTPYTPPTTFAN